MLESEDGLGLADSVGVTLYGGTDKAAGSSSKVGHLKCKRTKNLYAMHHDITAIIMLCIMINNCNNNAMHHD